MTKPILLSKFKLGPGPRLDEPAEILVIKVKIGDSDRFLTKKFEQYTDDPRSWLTFNPVEAHHWRNEDLARACAQDLALSYFRGCVVELVRLKRVRKGEYRAN